MMQPNGVAPPQMDQQYQVPQQQWSMMPPQQQQQQQPQVPSAWGQQPPSQVPPQQQQYGGAAAQNAAGSQESPNEIRSLWIGDLLYWMDENYLANCFYTTGEFVNAKVIRSRQTGQHEGYGFLEFRSRAAAEQILQGYNGTQMPNSEQKFRLNWASLGAGEKRTDESSDYTIFVGDLASDVTDYLLQETFKSAYSSVKGAKVVTDRSTGRSKGYGFVRFADENEQVRAMTEMNGVVCSSRAMRIGLASSKKTMDGPKANSYQSSQGRDQGESDPNNTTIFVGGLDPNVTDEHLRQVFSPYGELVHVKIPVGKRCGFVQFANRNCAESALSALNGTPLGSQNIRLSWGRSPSNKQPEQAQWNAAPYYGYAQGYEAYGYAPPAQDPNMYYGNYAGYSNYQQPQQ